MKKSQIIIAFVAIHAVLYGGFISGQNQSLSIDEVQRKIVPSHEIWVEYSRLKESPLTAPRRTGGTVTRPANQPQQSRLSSNIDRKIIPSHEIWLKYERLKHEMTPAGMAERERREAEARAAAERAEAERIERERQEVLARREAEREEAARRAAERRAEAEAARIQREEEERRVAERAEQERIEAERIAEENRIAEARRIEGERQRQIAAAIAEANRPRNVREEFRERFPGTGAIGRGSFNNLAQYGNASLMSQKREADRILSRAGLSERAAAQAEVNRIDALIANERRNINQRNFYDTYSYNVNGQQFFGNESSISIAVSLDIDFHNIRVGQTVTMPTRNGIITGNIATVNRTIITISVRGNTNILADIVDNRNNYRFRIQFTNLHYDNRARANVQDINFVRAQ